MGLNAEHDLGFCGEHVCLYGIGDDLGPVGILPLGLLPYPVEDLGAESDADLGLGFTSHASIVAHS
jgi:hypothetical protein